MGVQKHLEAIILALGICDAKKRQYLKIYLSISHVRFRSTPFDFVALREQMLRIEEALQDMRWSGLDYAIIFTVKGQIINAAEINKVFGQSSNVNVFGVNT